MKRLRDGYVAMAVCAMGLATAAFTAQTEPGTMAAATSIVAPGPIERVAGTDGRMGSRKVNFAKRATHRAKPETL